MSVRTSAERRTRTGRILVCDDERNIVRLIESHLTRAGHVVTTAYSGADAVSLVRSQEFDLVILDVMMPGMDGFDVLKSIRTDPATAELPVMMVTAKSQDEDVFKGYQYGVHAYLTKPIDFGDLNLFVRSLLSGDSGSS